MSIIQALIGSIVSSGSGGGGPPPAPTTYPVTLAATGGSLYFSVPDRKLQITDQLSDFTVGTGDFTVECWIWMLDSSYSNARIFTMGSWPNAKLGLSLENGTVYLWGEGAGGANNNAGGGIYTTADLYDTWTHIAVSRVSGLTKVFFNGVSVLTTGNSYNVVTEDNFIIGNEYGQAAGFAGYIKDFRFIKGVGVYSSDFTPPLAPLTATAETKLLISVNSSIGFDLDQSANPHSVGNAGVGYADVGPYDLALHVDAFDPASFTTGDMTTWFDLSPAQNHLTLTNVSWSGDGTTAQIAFASGGNQGYATSQSDSIAYALNGRFPSASVSFWANVTNTSGYQHIAGFRGADKFHVLNLGNGTNFECRVDLLNGPGYFDNLPSIGARLGTMTHYAFVVNGTRSDFYANGVLLSTTTNISGSYGGTLGYFGIAATGGSFQATNLEMGELRYYNRARSPKEILAEFTATRTRYGV